LRLLRVKNKRHTISVPSLWSIRKILALTVVRTTLVCSCRNEPTFSIALEIERQIEPAQWERPKPQQEQEPQQRARQEPAQQAQQKPQRRQESTQER
jgi:hypothetical protein